MKNTDKVTLTLGQIKRLIRETNNDLESQLKDAQEKLKQARKEYKTKQGRGMSGVLLKKAEDKVAELKKQIKNSVEEASEKTWRGITGTKFIWNGEWADPEVEYDGEIINANELEDFAWGIYVKDCESEGKEPSEDEFDEDLPVKFFKDALNDYMFGRFGDIDESIEDDEDLSDNTYDEKHAEEWMERHPHGYYNSEDDYGEDDLNIQKVKFDKAGLIKLGFREMMYSPENHQWADAGGDAVVFYNEYISVCCGNDEGNRLVQVDLNGDGYTMINPTDENLIELFNSYEPWKLVKDQTKFEL